MHERLGSDAYVAMQPRSALRRTPRLEAREGRLVAVADTPVTDDDVAALVDAGRR